VNENDKKAALLMIPYGLYVVGVTDGTSVSAFTANWLSQCSFTPPLIMMGVKKDSRAHALLDKGRVFSVNMLGGEHKNVAAFFFRGPEAEESRFGNYAFEQGEGGVPLLTDAPASVECRVTGFYPHGDHSVVVGEVIGATLRREAKPLTMESTGWKYGG